MRRSMTAALILVAALATAAPAGAINCEQARKYATTGRSAEDIADTMVADPAEVKKCLAGGEAQGSGKAAAPPAGKPVQGTTVKGSKSNSDN